MNKVHSIEKEIPEMEEPAMEKKLCEYLYIEADEEHIHRQKDGKEQGKHLQIPTGLHSDRNLHKALQSKKATPAFFSVLFI